MGKTNSVHRVSSLVIIISLIFQQTGFAQMSAQIDLSDYLGGLKSSSVKDVYRPAHLRYFSYDNLTDNFKLLLEKGDFLKSVGTGRDLSVTNAGGQDNKIKQEAHELLKYFLTGVSLQDDRFWVNLRPDSEEQVIDNWLEKTDVGKIMLEADLQLKKDTAMWTSPQTAIGRKYWDKLYKKAAELYGYDNVTIPTLTRPWIVPGEIIVRESWHSAYVYKAVLKVMLEQDYLKGSSIYDFKDERAKALNEYSSQLIRDMIIPKLTKEVNSSKRYAALRQVYYSLILSRWFKMRFSGKQGIYSSLINSENLTNLTSQEAWSKITYFKQYQKSFTEGEYNIKEPVSTPTGQVIRSYFSGGVKVWPNMGMKVLTRGNNIVYEVSAAMPGIVPIQGMANLNLADLRIAPIPIGKAANTEITPLRPGKKASSGITFEEAKDEIFGTLVNIKSMTVEEAEGELELIGAAKYSAEEILKDLAFNKWTVSEFTDDNGDQEYYYSPFCLVTQVTNKTDMEVAKEVGATGGLVGHSETREEEEENNKDVNRNLKRIHSVFGKGGVAIMAMGEPGRMRYSKDEPNAGALKPEGKTFLTTQVREGLAGLTQDELEHTIVANEPIWAIGPKAVGVATPQQAQDVNALIRNELPATVDRNKASITYGGSMSEKNAQGLMSMEDVDGGLIGGASLTTDAFLKLIRKVVETVRRQKKDGIFNGRIPYLGFNFKAEIGGTKIEPEHLRRLMNIFKFIKDNLSDIDFENELRIYLVVAPTEVSLFARALRGENPVDLIDLRGKELPRRNKLAVQLDVVSRFDPKADTGAHTGQITAEALMMAGFKAVVVPAADIKANNPKVKRAEAAGLEIVKLGKIPKSIKSLFDLKQIIYDDSIEDELIVVVPELAREAYAIANELQAENAGHAIASSVVKFNEDLTSSLQRRSVKSRIESLKATEIIEIIDSLPVPTIKTSIKLRGGIVATAAVPSGALTGEREALELRDGQYIKDIENGERSGLTVEQIRRIGKMVGNENITEQELYNELKTRFGGEGVLIAVDNVNNIIGPAIKNLYVTEQRNIDQKLIELNGTEVKEKLGTNAIFSVSLAVARAAARQKDLQLYEYVAELGGRKPRIPLIQMFNIINKSEHAGLNLDFKEFMIVPLNFNTGVRTYKERLEIFVKVYNALNTILKRRGQDVGVGWDSNKDALNLIVEAIKAAGYESGSDVAIALHPAASQFYDKGKKKYIVGNKEFTSQEMVAYYGDLVEKYPIFSITNGIDENDEEGRLLITETAKNWQRKAARIIKEVPKNSILIELNQIETLSELLDMIGILEIKGYSIVISDGSRETNDEVIADIVVGAGTNQIKTGAAGGEWNRIMAIEERMKDSLGVSSSVSSPGGISFRSKDMNIKLEGAGISRDMDLSLPVLSDSQLNKINIDSEIQQIKKMVSSGISLSGSRMKELVAACQQKGKMGVYSRDLLLCVMNACELAEVNADASSGDFMTALAFVDSRN